MSTYDKEALDEITSRGGDMIALLLQDIREIPGYQSEEILYMSHQITAKYTKIYTETLAKHLEIL